mgnify:CR=1 FL=1
MKFKGQNNILYNALLILLTIILFAIFPQSLSQELKMFLHELLGFNLFFVTIIPLFAILIYGKDKGLKKSKEIFNIFSSFLISEFALFIIVCLFV